MSGEVKTHGDGGLANYRKVEGLERDEKMSRERQVDYRDWISQWQTKSDTFFAEVSDVSKLAVRRTWVFHPYISTNFRRLMTCLDS